MKRPEWADLPATARTAVADRCGRIVKAETANRGISGGLAARLYTEHGSVFLKAVPSGSQGWRFFTREQCVTSVLPPGVPAPGMLWSGDVAGWALMLLTHIDGREIDLSPGSSDIPLVLDAMAIMEQELTPNPAPSLRTASDLAAILLETAATLLTKPVREVPARETYKAALSAMDWAELPGDTLAHADLHGGNLLARGSVVYVLDWAQAAVGPPWMDAALFAPRLIQAGHTPAQADALLADLTSWRTVPRSTAAGLTTLWTIYRQHEALYGPEHTRPWRARAFRAGQAWAEHLSALE